MQSNAGGEHNRTTPDRSGVDVVIIGAGMYVCGKGTEGLGTILPTVLQGQKQGLVRTIHLAATSPESVHTAREKALATARLLGVEPDIRYYPDGDGRDPIAYRQALVSVAKPAGAIVSVPDHLHFDVTKEVLEAGQHVLVVKPLVSRVAHALELIRLQKAHNLYGAVEYHKRFDEANLKLRELIRSRALGDLLNIRINYSQRKVIPTTAFRHWVDTTNVFQYLGVHYVDLISFLTDAVPVKVMAYGTKTWLATRGIDNYDTIQTQIEWQDGNHRFLSSHFTGWIDPDATSAMSDQRIEIIGTDGRCRSDQKNRGMHLATDTAGVEDINPYFTQIYATIDDQTKCFWGYGPRSITQFLEDVSAIVFRGVRPDDLGGLRPTFAASLYPTAVLEAAARSLKSQHQWIEIADVVKEAEH
jgi:predicted dehydrogenase